MTGSTNISRHTEHMKTSEKALVGFSMVSMRVGVRESGRESIECEYPVLGAITRVLLS